MFRTLAILLAFTTAAAADEPVQYCNDDVPYGLVEYEGKFIITQQHGNDTCVREDAIWYKCNDRDDYKLAFQVSEDGNEVWLWTPLYKEGEHETFTRCDI